MTQRDTRSIPLRLGLIGTGLIVLQTATFLWVLTESFSRPVFLILCALGYLWGMIFLVLGMLTHVPEKSVWLILLGLIGVLWSFAYIEHLNFAPLSSSQSDNTMIAEYAAEALKRGSDPYQWNFSDMNRVFRDRGLNVTTFLDGSPQFRVTYPSLPTWMLLALGPFGLGSARVISLLFHTLLLILLFVGAPGRLRPLILLPLFIARTLLHLTLGGVQDIVWCAMLVAMLLCWRRPTLRALLFGLACAFRQQPWFVAPFLLIYLWNESGPPRTRERSVAALEIRDYLRRPRLALADARLGPILRFISISFGCFLLINLPFILWDPRAWILGVFEPAYAAFNVHSEGIGALSKFGLLALPREFYTGMQFSALAIMLLIHWRHPGRVGRAFWVFPAIFFWLYYRGLINYWIYWIPPLLFAVARYHALPRIRSRTDMRVQPTIYVAGALAAANMVWGAILGQAQPAVVARLSLPIESFNGRAVARLGVVVSNGGQKTLQPRFAVQHDGLQPLPWDIESGPRQLMPGESAQYMISNYAAWRDFSAAHGAQIVVTDASNDYHLRAVINVPGDRTFASPDLIVNPSFVFWAPGWDSPAAWSWFGTDEHAANPRLEVVDGRTALVLPVQSGLGLLSQTVTFPDSFSIWVRPETIPAGMTDESYGVQIDDGAHRLRVLFGDYEDRKQVDDNAAIVYVRAPLEQWSRQTVDVSALYAEFGWAPPPYTIRSRRGLEFAARQVNLRLLVEGAHVARLFGAIEQDPRFASGRALVDEAIAHPDDYYVNMGDEYCRQRNVDLARQAYLRALDYNPDNALARERVGACP